MLFSALTLFLSQAPPPPPLPRQADNAPILTPPPLPNPPSSPTPGGSPSTVTVRCPSECSVRASGGTGRRINPQQWEFTGVHPGQTRFDIDGPFTLPLASGYLVIPGASDVEVLVSQKRPVLGTVRPRVTTEAATVSTVGTAPGILRMTCQKPCTVNIDGARRSGENQMGQITITNVTPGSRNVSVKFISGSAHALVDVPADSEVFLFAQESGLKVTNTKPIY